MDTILNLGMNEDALKGLAEATGNERFAWDSYQRFIHMFANVVMEIPKDKFEHILTAKKQARGAKADTDLNAKDLKELVGEFKALYLKETGEEFPSDPWKQLTASRMRLPLLDERTGHYL